MSSSKLSLHKDSTEFINFLSLVIFDKNSKTSSSFSSFSKTTKYKTNALFKSISLFSKIFDSLSIALYFFTKDILNISNSSKSFKPTLGFFDFKRSFFNSSKTLSFDKLFNSPLFIIVFKSCFVFFVILKSNLEAKPKALKTRKLSSTKLFLSIYLIFLFFKSFIPSKGSIKLSLK